jgi:hypothetical protein
MAHPYRNVVMLNFSPAPGQGFCHSKLSIFPRLSARDLRTKLLWRFSTQMKETTMESPRSKRQTGRSRNRTRSARASSSRGGKSTKSTSRQRSQSRSASRSGARASVPRGGRAAAAESTQDLETIRSWAEERGGKPATVKSTRSQRNGAGILRIDFPGYSGAGTLEEISWDEWYEKFQENNLTFLYQDRTKDGKQSRFFKLVCEPKGRTSSRKSTAKSSKS